MVFNGTRRFLPYLGSSTDITTKWSIPRHDIFRSTPAISTSTNSNGRSWVQAHQGRGQKLYPKTETRWYRHNASPIQTFFSLRFFSSWLLKSKVGVHWLGKLVHYSEHLLRCVVCHISTCRYHNAVFGKHGLECQPKFGVTIERISLKNTKLSASPQGHIPRWISLAPWPLPDTDLGSVPCHQAQSVKIRYGINRRYNITPLQLWAHSSRSGRGVVPWWTMRALSYDPV